MNRNRVIAYTRVSTLEQANEGISLAAQKKRLEAHCVAKGWELVKVVVDAGVSAKNLNRDGAREILELVRRRECDVVVVVKLDRMFRNATDALNTTNEFRRYGVDFASLTEDFDTSTAAGKMFFSLIATFAEFERNLIGDRTREALASKRADGYRVGEIPLGYEADDDGLLVPVEDEQRIVDRILGLREQGYGYLRIAKQLNRDGVPAKKGGKWYPKTIRGVLQRQEVEA
ncbi:MAG: recombinase family protein [Planctomycetes bacterium]|nr:recombinase family protein [Planctomycetota bacterium]